MSSFDDRWDEAVRNLKIADPKTEDELFSVLGISPLAPEGYYVAMVWEALIAPRLAETKDQCRGDETA